MTLGPHAAFIIASYAAGAVIIAALIGWIVRDYRAQAKTIAELEQRGVTRRSAARGKGAVNDSTKAAS